VDQLPHGEQGLLCAAVQVGLAACTLWLWRRRAELNHFAVPETADGARLTSSGRVMGRKPLTERMLNLGSSFYNAEKKPGKCAAP
jgi:hypothetical protein